MFIIVNKIIFVELFGPQLSNNPPTTKEMIHSINYRKSIIASVIGVESAISRQVVLRDTACNFNAVILH